MMQDWMKVPNLADRRLKLTSTRLQNLRKRQTSLVDICKHILVDAMVDRSAIPNNFQNFGAYVQQKFLDCFLAIPCTQSPSFVEFERRKKIFFHLLKTRPNIGQSINLDGIMTFCPIERKGRQLCVMINAIQFYVPYVQQFFISENVCHLGQPKKYLCLREEPNCVFLSRTALQSVGLLKFICQLTISSFVINFMDLKMLCENHENLIIVEVLLHFRNRVLPEVLEDSTSALSRLRMFSFSPARDDYDKESFRLLWRACLVHLPKLHIIRARVGSVGSNSVHPEEVIQFMTDPQLNNKIYELRHLLIIPEICPYPVMFPRVTHLEIMWPEDMIFTEEDVHATMTFVTTLKSLSLINVPCANTLTRYLKRYGLNLTELLLSNSPGWDDDAFNYDLKNIFALCPALEKLRLTGINLLDTSSPPKFSKLRRLHFQSHERARNNFAVIVRAPELKDLFLEGANFDLNDISEVASLIKSGHILGKLERLHIIATKIPNPHSVYIRRMRELVLNASAYLKTLTDVNLLTKVGMQRDKILSSFKLNRLLQLYNGRGC